MKKELIVPSALSSIKIVENFVDEIAECLLLSTDEYGNILLSVVEGVSNGILHGNKKNVDKNVHVIANYDKSILKISIKDEGKGFDFDKIPNPTDIENIEKPNGRGIFLMKYLSDELVFKEKGTIVILKFKIK